jgi:hypothetical protein
VRGLISWRLNEKKLHGIALAADDIDLILAAESITFTPDLYLPKRKMQPIWDEPWVPPTSYNCVCATAVYSSEKRFTGCMADGCDGCMICRTE